MSTTPDLSHIAAGLRPLAVPLGDLILDPANARLHPQKNMDAIQGSLRVYGQRKPIVVNKRTMIVEAGNGTLAAAQKLGWTHLAAVFVDDDPATAAGFAVSDNRCSDLSEFDPQALDRLIRDIDTGNDEDLDAMIADLTKELDLYSPAETGDPAEEPEPASTPSRFGVLITCRDEREQQRLLAKLQGDGYDAVTYDT